jgi:uncharacterized alpha-E superfamily protein
MLSRVADRIFWMSRQMERAENMARILGVTSNLVLFGNHEAQEQNLLAPLTITGTAEAFAAQHDKLTLPALIDFLAFDQSNPSSIWSCLRDARENAHAVRWQITSEMWETLNATWLELKGFKKKDITGSDATRFFDWVKDRSHLFRGVTYGTIVRGEAFNFSRLGTFLERADNTARLLDVKFNALKSEYHGAVAGDGSQGADGEDYDFYQWSAILRSVSGFEVYRKVYRDVIRPERVAALLILRPDMPRSLLGCLNEVMRNLAMVSSDPASETRRRAGKLRADLQYARIDEILATGLHAFLTQFLDRVNEIGAHISREFLVPSTH